MSERFPRLGVDRGGGGEGGGAGGAGSGSWTVVGLGGGTPEEPDGDPRVADTGAHVIDRFNDRVVAPPTVTGGGSAGTFVAAGQARSSRVFTLRQWVLYPDQDDAEYVETPFEWIGGRKDGIGSHGGQWQAHTSRPTWSDSSGASITDFCLIGYDEAEQWWKLTVGAHPVGGAAGVAITVTRHSTRLGYASVGDMEVVVASAQPTAMRQGTVIGTVGASATTLTIPAGSIPAEGSELWVGYRTAWQTSYKTRIFGWYYGWPSYGYGSASDLDDGGHPYVGYSGRDYDTSAPASATWQEWTGGAVSFGSTITPDDTTPFGGPHTWTASEQVGSPTYGIDEGFYVESTAAAVKAVTLTGPVEDEDEDDGAWSMYEGWRVDVEFSVDALGLPAQSGERSISISSAAEGLVATATVHLGDGTRAMGISVLGGAGTEYLAKTLSADTRYVLAMDTRSGSLRAKVWEVTGGIDEPAAWDVETTLATTDDESDHFTVRCAVGNIVSSQKLTVHRVAAYAAGRDSDTVIGELIGLADGDDRSFATAHPYEPATVMPMVNGMGAAPATEDAGGAAFGLDGQPTAGSILRCRYVIASPTE